MIGNSFIHRIYRARGREIVQFAEAAVMLAAASVAIKVLPFKTVVRMMSLPRARAVRRRARDGELVVEVRRAIKRASTRLPWRIVCFPEGLAAHWMLRRRGVPSWVHYGLRQSDSKLSAHVWVTLGGAVVVGEETADCHTCVAVFPPASP